MSSTNAPTVGVVIRSLNEERQIGRLLTGLSHQSRTPDQIILIDSGSTDATIEIAQRFGVNVVSIDPSEFSFGRSLNIGIDACKTDLIVIASAHVYPLYDSWVSLITAPMRDREEVALAYGRQLGDERTKYSERRLMLRWFPETSDPQQTHPFANNANSAIRRSVWSGEPYDEELTGLEDLAWAKRILSLGFQLAYVSEAPVVHVHEETWTRLMNRYRREAIAHQRIFHDQRLSRTEAAVLGIRNTVSDYSAALRDGQLTSNIAAIPAFHAAQFIGAYRGFAQKGSVSEQLKRRFYFPTEPQAPSDVPHIGSPIDYADPDGASDVD